MRCPQTEVTCPFLRQRVQLEQVTCPFFRRRVQLGKVTCPFFRQRVQLGKVTRPFFRQRVQLGKVTRLFFRQRVQLAKVTRLFFRQRVQLAEVTCHFSRRGGRALRGTRAGAAGDGALIGTARVLAGVRGWLLFNSSRKSNCPDAAGRHVVIVISPVACLKLSIGHLARLTTGTWTMPAPPNTGVERFRFYRVRRSRLEQETGEKSEAHNS